MKASIRRGLMTAWVLASLFISLIATPCLAWSPDLGGMEFLAGSAPPSGVWSGEAVSYQEDGGGCGVSVQSADSLGSSIHLNLINKSSETPSPQVVLFQKNQAGIANEEVVAWTVIEGLGAYDNHPFDFPTTYTARVSDRFGNYTPSLQVIPGQRYQAYMDISGLTLHHIGTGSSSRQVQIVNSTQTRIGATAYKDGKRVGAWPVLQAGETKAFDFTSTLWIGVGSWISEGSLFDPNSLESLTLLSLEGVASADIIMSGGGDPGWTNEYQFTLENVITRE